MPAERATAAALLVSAAVILDRLRRLARFAAAEHRLPRVVTPGGVSVSAVVPMRDEERHAAGCVRSLLASGPDLVEVIAVDDGSTDGTRAALLAVADARLKTLAAPAAPSGEHGKAIACSAGAAAAQGEWLWFVDADVRVAPDLLGRLLAAADERAADLVTAVGRLARSGGVVGWLLPAVGFAVARRHDPARIADPTRPDAFAAGHCLLVRRDVYAAAGGHSAVAGDVVEDVALARLVKSRGATVLLAAAFDGFEVATYDDAASMWRGLLRNTSAVARPGAAGAAADIAGAVAQLTPFAIAMARRGRTRRLAACTLAAQVVVDAGARRVAGLPTRFALLTPFADVTLLAMRAQAIARRRRGGTVDWRGRAVRPG